MAWRFAAFLALALVSAMPSARAAQPFDGLFARATEARKVGDFAAAEGFLREALAVEPDRADALYLLGMIVAFRDRHDAALEILKRAEVLSPRDLDIRLGIAKVTSWSGRLDEAAGMVATLLDEHPDNVEAWNLKGRVAYYREDYATATDAFAHARSLAPDNLEAHIGGGDVAFASGRREQAEDLYRQAIALAPDSPDARERLDRLEAEPLMAKPWRLDVTVARSRFERQSRKAWRSSAARVTRRIDPTTTVFGAVENENRFAHTDTTLLGGATHRFAPWLDTYAEAGGTVAARFRPRWNLAAGGAARVLENGEFVGATRVLLDVRHREYEGSAVTDLNPGLRQNFLDDRLWITGKWINSFDRVGKRTAGWSVRADAQVLERLRLGGGWAAAPESDDGASIETRTLSAGAVIGLTSDVDLRLDYLREDREKSYVRKEVSTGLSMRF